MFDSLFHSVPRCIAALLGLIFALPSVLPEILFYVCVSLLRIFPLFAPFHTAFHSPRRLTLCHVSFQPDTQSVFKPKKTLPLSCKLLVPLHILSPWRPPSSLRRTLLPQNVWIDLNGVIVTALSAVCLSASLESLTQARREGGLGLVGGGGVELGKCRVESEMEGLERGGSF